MSQHANMVKMTVTSVGADPYTITLNAASSGYQSFASAYGANATVDILITEGTKWEVARNCTYTHSGTTVTRGTLESSSTGSRITDFTSAAVVTVVATADRGRTWDAAALEHVAGTDADVTMAVNSMYVVDMSAWATADRNYTLPATAAVGDRVGVMVTAGDASHELILKANTGDTLNGVSAAEWSRLFITGEVVIMRCVTANAAWIVEYDGRIPQKCLMRLSTSVTTNTAGAWTVPTAASGAWTADINVGSIAGTSDSRCTARRGGNYSVSAGGITNSTMANAKEFAVGVWKNGTQSGGGSLVNNQVSSVSGTFYGSTVFICSSVNLATSDYLVYHFLTTDANMGLLGAAAPRINSHFAFAEILP